MKAMTNSMQSTIIQLPYRKHLPVLTTIETKTITKPNPKQPQGKIGRQLDLSKVENSKTEIRNIKEIINEGKIEEATTRIERIMKSAQVRHTQKKRRSKPWFDAECYKERQKVLQHLHRLQNMETALDTRIYTQARRKYKTLLRRKQENHTEQEAQKIINLAETNPFAALQPRKTFFTQAIQMKEWEEHFKAILNTENTEQAYNTIEKSPENFYPITKDEVTETIQGLKTGKAAGPDETYNEHLKEAIHVLADTWRELFNKCIETNQIPSSWRTSIIKLIYKGKGNAQSPDSYRGIALSNTIAKVFTKIITKRMTKEVDHLIPEEQFGFRKGRSTLQAISILQADIQDALRTPKGKLYTAFIDYSKAFDSIVRENIKGKLEEMLGPENYLATTTINMLKHNTITIDNNIERSKAVTQTNGVLQGDPLSPLLYNIATADIIQAVTTESTKAYLYADDMALSSKNHEDLQNSLNKLATWAEENGLKINISKSALMIFRRGGKVAEKEKLKIGSEKLEVVNDYKYLGITMQTSGTTFNKHVKQKAIAAIAAMRDIRQIREISLETAMKIFKTKIIPILTYGIHIIGEYLKLRDLKVLENIKALYLKKVLGVSKYTPSRYVYLLTREPFLIEDLRYNLLLPSTTAYNKLLAERQQKREEVEELFYCTSAMIDRSWTKPNQEMRSVVNRLAVHGFHHKLCKTTTYHTASDLCVCKLCNEKCTKYHVLSCKENKKTITELSSED